jgi:DNA-binding PadR family transcriptional regulator
MFNNFGERFAYQFQGGEQGGWTPPWLREDEPEHHHGHHHHGHHHGHHHDGPQGWWDPRFFMRRGRGPFGPGPFGPGPFGPGAFGPKGPQGEGQRFFGRGDVKFALLELLRERPMHGYEMMKALEEKSGGFYTPSAGTIYPTLQMLEDRNLVTAQEADGKKVYSITDAGRAFLEEEQKKASGNEEFAGPPWARGRGFGPRGPRGFRNAPEMQALGTEAREVARLFAIAARSSFNNPEQATRLRTIIETTRKDLSDLIYGTNPGTGSATPPESTETPGVEQA